MRPLVAAPLLRQESVSLEITKENVEAVIPKLGLERQDKLTESKRNFNFHDIITSVFKFMLHRAKLT